MKSLFSALSHPQTCCINMYLRGLVSKLCNAALFAWLLFQLFVSSMFRKQCLGVTWSADTPTDFNMLLLLFFLSKRQLVSSCHRVTPAPVDADSLLGCIPYFLAHTASTICQCQMTVLINRSALAAVKTRNCAVKAGGSWHHLSRLCCASPPSETLGSDVALPL